jgi:tetratricopeptide (TPR) repeat protein
MDNHPDLEKNLREASVYAIDRSRIYELFKNPQLELMKPSNVTLAPEGLEITLPNENLKEPEVTANKVEDDQDGHKDVEFGWLDETVENLESVAPHEEERQNRNDSTELRKKETPLLALDGMFEKYLAHVTKLFSGILNEENENLKNKSNDEIVAGEVPEEIQRQPEQLKNLQKLLKHKGNNKNEETASEDEKIDDAENQSLPKPMPKERFESWNDQVKNFEIEFDALEQYVFEAVEEEEADRKEDNDGQEKKSDAVSLAKRSLKLKSGIVSETLAELLVKQENYAQAIEMYEQLILKYPEKSAFFALQIENLKNS